MHISKKYSNFAAKSILIMKRTLLITLCLLLLTFGNAAPLQVAQLSDDKEQELLFIIGTIVLKNNQLSLVDKQGEILYQEDLPKVRSIIIHPMGEGTGVEEAVVPRVVAFPNPTTASLHLRGVEDDAEWRVYDLQGRLMIKGNGLTVPAESLPIGDYILQVKTHVVKFIKH